MKTNPTTQGVTGRATTALESRGATGAGNLPQIGREPQGEPSDGQGEGVDRTGNTLDGKTVNGFMFYRLYREIYDELPRCKRLAFIETIFKYMFDGVPVGKDTPQAIRLAFTGARHLLDISKERAKAATAKTHNQKNKRNQTKSNAPKKAKGEEAKGEEAPGAKAQGEKVFHTVCENGAPGGANHTHAKKTSSHSSSGGLPSSLPHPSIDEILSGVREHMAEVPETFAREFFADMEQGGWCFTNSSGATVVVDCRNWRMVLHSRWKHKKNSAARAVDDIPRDGTRPRQTENLIIPEHGW